MIPRFQTLCALSAMIILGGGRAFADEASAAPAAAGTPAVTLQEVVSAAREASPAVKLASLTLESSRAQFVQARATNGLSLGGKAGYFHQGDLPGTGSTAAAAGTTALNGENIQAGLALSGPATSLDLTAQHTIETSALGGQVSSLNLSGSQTVFDGYPGGRSAAAVQQAEYTYRAAQVTYDASVKSALYQVRQAYYTMLSDQNTVLIRQASVRQAEQNLSYYKGLLTAGRATELDVLQSEVTLTQAQLDLQSAQNTVDVDRRNLSLAAGWPLDREYRVAEAPAPEPPALSAEDALKTAYQNRPELRTLELDAAAAGVGLSLQKSQAFPVVSLTGSLGVDQDWSSNAGSGTFTIGASIALPPFLDGGLHGAQVQQAADQVESLKVQQDQERQVVTIAVQSALFAVTDARSRLELAGRSVTAAQGQYNLQKARYAVGLVTTLDVLTAFQALTAAQVGMEQARSGYALAVLNLDNAMGL